MKKAELFVIKNGTLELENIIGKDCNVNRELIQITATQFVLNNHYIADNIKRGDVIVFEDREAHSLSFIWNGKLLIELDDGLPKEFTLGEFPIYYWNDTITSNMRWPTKNIVKQIKENAKENNHGCVKWFSFFILNGCDKYIVHPSTNDNDKYGKLKYYGEGDFWLDALDYKCGFKNQMTFYTI